MDILEYQRQWLLKTGRIKDPARGTPERVELVEAFMRATVMNTAKTSGRPRLVVPKGKRRG